MDLTTQPSREGDNQSGWLLEIEGFTSTNCALFLLPDGDLVDLFISLIKFASSIDDELVRRKGILSGQISNLTSEGLDACRPGMHFDQDLYDKETEDPSVPLTNSGSRSS